MSKAQHPSIPEQLKTLVLKTVQPKRIDWTLAESRNVQASRN